MAFRSESGFSLIELITVVVVLAVLATIGTGFIVSATESYQQTQARALLVNTGRQAVERMTRQIRGALPYSVNVTNNGSCVKFMPIASGGFYRESVPDQANQASAHTSIETTPHDIEFGEAVYLSIGAMDSTELYGASAASRALMSGRTPTSVTFPSKVWERNSLNRRFYLLDEPAAFCLFGGELRYYPEQDVQQVLVDTEREYNLLARHAQTVGTAFTLSAASDSRNVILNMNLGFSEGGESVSFQQEVLIRNVP